MNPYKEAEESSFSSSLHVNYEDIASKLLKDHYFLTALELHTELVESGKELPQLREFFSNPGNFEQHVTRAADFTSMHRTPSLATLDSLDTARYSEDGGGDRAASGGEVAVLEFELRKAKETINALRANLTQFADGESSLEKKFADNTQRTLKPHEKRALNFLINEYLLLQDYKLTSITFSDENPDQEFEDWDDVGLNMPRPDGLISLFWGGTSKLSPKIDASTETDKLSLNVQCQTDLEVCSNCQRPPNAADDWSHEVLLQAEEIQLLKQNIIALETEKLNFQKLYDEAIVTLNSLTSPTSESRDLVLQLPEDRTKVEINVDDIKADNDSQEKPITYMASENHYGSGNSTHSATPDQFEMVYSDKNNILLKKEKEDTYEQPVFMDSSIRGSPLRPGSVNTLESLSINDASEWTRVQYEYATDNTKETWIESNIIPNNLKEMLLAWSRENCHQDDPLSNDLLLELLNSEKPIEINGLLPLVVETLPRILPHTLLGRRGEAAALLAAGAALACGARRARLLHALLTMYKKPDSRDAHLICQAACLVVKWGGSGEVLASVAELLASKTAERRLLASQVCLAIAPYVPLELCTSLFLSLVALMCESSEREIRAIGLVAASLVCPVAEHKYSQLESIMFNFLKDPYEKNVQNTVKMFLPIMARCALISGKFHSDLYKRILSNCSKACDEGEWKNVELNLDVMRVLVLAKLVYVANVQIVKDAVCDMDNTLQDVPLSELTNLTDLDCFLSSDMGVNQLISSMNSLLKQKPELRWPELNWMINTLQQILEVTTKSKMLNHHTSYELLIALFNTYVEKGGVHFTIAVLRPLFVNFISVFEKKLEKLDTISNDMFIVVGVYSATVLIHTENPEKCGIFLQKWLVHCSTRALPVAVFSVPFKWLAKHKPDVLCMFMKHLKEFSASAGESINVGAIRIYTADLTTELLNTAAVGDDCLLQQAVPLVLELLDDGDVGVREAALMAWGRVWFECSSRAAGAGEAAEGAESLAAKADELLRRSLSAREAARMAHALALLVTEESQVDVAVSALCTLTSRLAGVAGAVGVASGTGVAGGASGEAVAALSAALQLAAHHAPAHPALLPAARKLETIVQAPSLSQYKPTVDALLQRAGGAASVASVTPSPRLDAATEVGRRVSQMFNAKAGMNLQNIFKKKT